MSLFYDQKVPRLSFGRIPDPTYKMNLNAVQLESYKKFLGVDGVDPKDSGIHTTLSSVFPIESVSGYARLEYVSYRLADGIFDIYDCKRYSSIYGADLKITLRLVVYDKDSPKNNKKIKHKIEEEVSLGDIPLMTPTGSFVINGTERVVVSQLHRSPGVFFVHDKGKGHVSGKLLYQARVIPYRGSWLDFEFDVRDRVYFRIDRKRKMPVTILLKALGYDAEEILEEFYEIDKVKFKGDDATINMPPSHLRGLIITHDIVTKNGEVLLSAGERVLSYHIRQLEDAGIDNFEFTLESLVGRVLAKGAASENTGEMIALANQELTLELIEQLQSEGVKSVDIIYTNDVDCGPYISDAMALESCVNKTSALFEIYHMIRPGDPANKESAELLFENCFFNKDRYSLSAIGRMKLNAVVGDDSDNLLLNKEDIVGILKHLIAIRQNKEIVDDIDSLSNRRVRSVGEMVENQFRLGLFRIDRAIQDILGSPEIENMTPKGFLNAKPVNAAIKEFFSTGQMSQFMDQNNPLSEITHRRRITVLGPGGLSRDRSGFEVRDVHTTHYGRLCPIETPEGPNIGLINSLTTFAKTDEYGFLITPYFVVKNGKVSNEIAYCSVRDEKDKVIAQADQLLGGSSQRNANDLVPVRVNNEFMLKPVNEIDYMDISPKQIVSVAASLIPFLEHDDANRALMGSNMQRQAIPVLKREKPLVGTGMESVVAIESGAVVVARRSGTAISVDSKRVVIRVDKNEVGNDVGLDIYNLVKYQKSNHNTCINQNPIISVGASIRAGDVIADGSCTDNGELALGQNVRIAFMSWNGYNFEDSIIISEHLVREDCFTSIHIEEFNCTVRSTKLGDEEITADIPNVTEGLLAKLDESGIVRVGAEVESGDILVGRITPKGETQLTPEEKLLRAIFGEKASDVKDSSLRMPSSISGTVVDVQIQVRGSNYQNQRGLAIEQERLQQIDLDEQEELAMLGRVYSDLRERLLAISSDDSKLSSEKITKMTDKQLLSVSASDAEISDLQKKISNFSGQIKQRYENKRKVVSGASNLSPGVLAIVKVYVAIKRHIQPGDKIAGRHGNKGIISAVVPAEDMPYDKNGLPVDMILNPLGVPSRMNVGQILETHLGMASHQLGKRIEDLLKEQERHAKLRSLLMEIYGDKHDFTSYSDDDIDEVSNNLKRGVPFATPVFDGAKESDIDDMLELSGLDTGGKIALYDGRTGDAFSSLITVGYMYMLKLNHLVDDKMHARSTGSYSLITQQPLGGKAQFGGQRFGEMEVWALEAYGAAYTLQEMLTVKADDMEGRKKMYKNIADGQQYSEFGIPESFNVLVREIRSLALDIDIE